MQRLRRATIVIVLTGVSASYARGGMHGGGMHAPMAPANPTVPPR
jgi:hypothetical protein